MAPESLNLLSIIAEVAIGTVALSGITMVLVMTRQAADQRRAGHVIAQLAMASAVVIGALLPMLIERFDLDAAAQWRLASAGYLAIIVFMNLLRLIPGSGFPTVYGTARRIVLVPPLTGFVLLGGNLFLGMEWPHVTQLMIALAVSLVLYINFVMVSISEDELVDESPVS